MAHPGAKRVRARVASLVAATIATTGALADGTPEGLCDIVMNPRMSVYMVMVGNEPYRNKGYLTWDDALKLRDVLVSAGACERAAPAKVCTLESLAADGYAVLRDGVNFDPYTKLRTAKAAREYARKLERVKLCQPLK